MPFLKPSSPPAARARGAGVCSAGMLAISLLLTAAPAQADTTWTGSTDTDWFTGANWNNGVPTSGTDAYIDLLSGPNVTATGAAASMLVVGNTATGSLIISDGGAVSDTEGYVGLNSGSNGTVTVTGTGSTWTNSAYLNVGVSGTGSLTISDGGAVSNTYGLVGVEEGSSGTVTVTGTGSRWTNSSHLYVGYYGTGSLTVSDGGEVSNTIGYVGYYSGSSGTVSVTGTGSTWNNSSYLFIGNSGTLTVSNGGAVSNTATGYVGYYSGSSGTVSVTGTGSTWTNSSSLIVGRSGTGSLTISDGGAVSNTNGYVGFAAGSSGTVIVTGTGSTWTNSSTLYIAATGTGSLTVSDGGAVNNTHGYVGYNAGSSGTVTVTGTGSTWNNSSYLFIGNSGTGSLTISDGGAVSNTNGYVGVEEGSSGTVIVTGTGSTWTNSSGLIVGNYGTGSLTVSDGGAAVSAGAYVGNNAGSNGTVTVTGTGSTWTNSSNLYVGFYGTGSLTVSNGGAVSDTKGYVGAVAGSNGTVTVTGTGSRWTNSSNLYVGYYGTGTLTVSNGGAVSNTATGYVGYASGSSGTVSVTGTGSTWTNSSALVVGRSGTGSLTVSDGGAVSNTVGQVGSISGSNGTVTVTGTGSSWTSSGYFAVGQYGTGTLTISDGGSVSVSDPDSSVGNGAGSTGTATVTGAGSSWTNSGNLYIGKGGTGSLTISNSGTVEVTGVMYVAYGAGSTGTVNIGAASGDAAAAAGTISASSLAFGSGTGKLVFNHTSNSYVFSTTVTGSGTIVAENGTTSLTGDLSGFTGSYSITGGTLNFGSSGTTTIANVLSGAGTLTFTSGTTTLTGDSSGFTGTTDVGSGGTLAVNGSLGGTLDVQSGGRLQGSGTAGTVTAESGGTVAPGNSIGTITVADVTFAAGSTYEVEVNAAGESDKIHATNTATINGGTVNLLPESGLYGIGQTYTILTADSGVTGTFTNVTFNTSSLFLTAALICDTNNVYASIVRNGTSFASVGATENQKAVAAGLDSMSSTPLVYNAVAAQSSAAAARAAYDSLSGEIHADIRGSLLEADQNIAGAVMGRLRQAQGAQDATPVAGKSQPAVARKLIDTRPFKNDYLRSYHSSATQNAGQTASSISDAAFWLQGFGDWSRRDNDGNAKRFESETKGFMLGADSAFAGKIRAGLAFGFTRGDYERDNESGTSNSYTAALYVGKKFGDFALRGGASASWHDIDTTRSVSFSGFSDYLKASYEAQTAQGFGEAAYAFAFPAQGTRLEPFASLTYGYEHAPSFTEQGGTAALTASSDDATLGSSLAGLRVSQSVAGFDAEQRSALYGMLGWKHAIGSTTPDARFRFVSGGGDSFTTKGASLARDALALNVGFDLALTRNASVGLFYASQLSDHTMDQTFSGSMKIRF